jgi:hypothetical protein
MREPKVVVDEMEAGAAPPVAKEERFSSRPVRDTRLSSRPSVPGVISMSSSRVSFVRALYDLFYVSLVKFQPKARVFAWNLVAANTAGLLFFPRVEPVVLWISIVTGLVFMARVYQTMGFVKLLGAGHALWILVVPWLAFRWAHLPEGSGWFMAWLGWVIVTDTISLVLDARDTRAFLSGDRAAYYASGS